MGATDFKGRQGRRGGYDAQNGHGSVPFRWTEESGLVDLGFPGGANDATTDGNVVVGWAATGAAADHIAFRWTSENGMMTLGDLPGGFNQSNANFVSEDGQVVVGTSHSFTGVEDGSQAFRWTAETGMVGLGVLGGQHSTPYGISDNGSLIVGNGFRGAWIWDESHGMRTFQDYLVNELQLQQIRSPDGRSVGSSMFLGTERLSPCGVVIRTGILNS